MLIEVNKVFLNMDNIDYIGYIYREGVYREGVNNFCFDIYLKYPDERERFCVRHSFEQVLIDIRNDLIERLRKQGMIYSSKLNK